MNTTTPTNQSLVPQMVIVILKPSPDLLQLPNERTGYFPCHILRFRLQQHGLLAAANYVPETMDRDKLLLLFPVTDIARALPLLKDELLYLGLLCMAEIGHRDGDGCLRLYYPVVAKPLHRHFAKESNWAYLIHPAAKQMLFLPCGILIGSVAGFIHWSIPLALALGVAGYLMRIGMRAQKIRRWLQP